MARVTGNTVHGIDIRILTIASNGTGTFAHGLAAAPDHVSVTVIGDVATAASASAVPLTSETNDGTNVSVKNYGNASCSVNVRSEIVHSVVG